MYTCFCVWEEGNVRRRTRTGARTRHYAPPTQRPGRRRVITTVASCYEPVITLQRLLPRFRYGRVNPGSERLSATEPRKLIRGRLSETYSTRRGPRTRRRAVKRFGSSGFHDRNTARLLSTSRKPHADAPNFKKILGPPIYNASPPRERILVVCDENKEFLLILDLFVFARRFMISKEKKMR